MIMASVIYHYFGVAWKLKKTEAHTHGEVGDEDGDAKFAVYEGEDEGEDTEDEDDDKKYKKVLLHSCWHKWHQQGSST